VRKPGQVIESASVGVKLSTWVDDRSGWRSGRAVAARPISAEARPLLQSLRRPLDLAEGMTENFGNGIAGLLQKWGPSRPPPAPLVRPLQGHRRGFFVGCAVLGIAEGTASATIPGRADRCGRYKKKEARPLQDLASQSFPATELCSCGGRRMNKQHHPTCNGHQVKSSSLCQGRPASDNPKTRRRF
jgi:hypothetical protein